MLQCATCVGFLVPPIRSDPPGRLCAGFGYPATPKTRRSPLSSKRLVSERRGCHSEVNAQISTSSSVAEHLSRGRPGRVTQDGVWRRNGREYFSALFAARLRTRTARRNDAVIAAPLASLLLREDCVYASPAERNSKHRSCYRLVGSNKHNEGAAAASQARRGTKVSRPQSDILATLRVLATLRAADASVHPFPFVRKKYVKETQNCTESPGFFQK